ncbi:PKD domain-containing protein [bacterium]|nr:PKD domain-containing protein [bacterium]
MTGSEKGLKPFNFLCIFFILVSFISSSILLMPGNVIAACSMDSPTLTPLYVFFYGTATIQGIGDVQPGDQIRAYVDSVETNNGCIGFSIIKNAGGYQSTALYGDDESTGLLKDGANHNDEVRFVLCHDGIEYDAIEKGIWDITKLNGYVVLNLTFYRVNADFSADPNHGCAPLNVNFTNKSTNATSYMWLFGDGAISTEEDPNHTYSSEGVYTVILTAIDDAKGLSDQKSDYITVVSGDPAAAFTGDPNTGCIPLTVTFHNNSTNAAIYYWEFGDGSTSAEENPTHTYTDANVYKVKLTATNDCNSVVEEKAGYITALAPPNAAFTADPNMCALAPVCFTNNSTNASNYSWDFGDGNTSTESDPCHTYPASGAYTVKLTAGNGYCSDEETAVINVNDKPVTDFSANPVSGCCPLIVQFNNITTNATSYLWDFGDGATSAETSPTHTYTVANVYNVTLTATNECGDTVETKNNYITVLDSPVAGFTYNADPNMCAPLAVTFINSSTNATSYLWDFGDGNTSTEMFPFYTYAGEGSYTVKLTAGNGYCSDEETTVINVNDKPVTDFSADTTTGFYPLNVQFTNNSTNADSYLWDFGDGNNSTLQNPSYTYPNLGKYTVTLTATNTCGDTVETKTDFISVIESIVYLDDQCTKDSGKTVNFNLGIMNPIAGINSFDLDIQIDTNILSYSGIARGGLLDPNFNLTGVFDPNTSTLNISASGGAIDPNVIDPNNPQYLATIAFTMIMPFGITNLKPVNLGGDFTNWGAQEGSLVICSPSLTGINPNSGPYYGGTQVTITGENFCGGTIIYFGDKQADPNDISSLSDDEITVLTPNMGEPKTVDVIVENPGVDPNVSILEKAFTYMPPSITQIIPQRGPMEGGGTVTIKGDYFLEGADIWFYDDPNDPNSGVSCPYIFIDTNTIPNTIQCHTPAWAAPCDRAYVNVINPDGQGSNFLYGYLFEGPDPQIYSVAFEDNESYGTNAGGEWVTIKGANFYGNIAVKFGGNNAVSPNLIDPNTIRCSTPAYNGIGPVDVEVTVCEGQKAVMAGGFIYRYPKRIYQGTIDDAAGRGGTITFFWGGDPKATATIDNSGNFQQQLTDAASLNPNYYDVLIQIYGYKPVTTQWGPEGFDPDDLNFEPVPDTYHRIDGHVSDYSGCSNIAGACVHLAGDPNVQAFTDDKGDYSMYVSDKDWNAGPDAVASADGYVSSDPNDIRKDPDFCLIPETRINAEFTTGSVNVRIWAEPAFTGSASQIKVIDISDAPDDDPNDGSEITGSFTFSNGSWSLTYPDPNASQVKLYILADTTEDNNAGAGYRARKIVFYDVENKAKTDQVEVKHQAGARFAVKTGDEDSAEIEITVPPNALQTDGDIKVGIIDPNDLDIADPNLVNVSAIIIEIDLEGASLAPGGYLELRIPYYNPDMIIDPNTGINLAEDDMAGHLNAFKNGWVYINHFKDIASIESGSGTTVPPEDIIYTYRDESLINYVKFRIYSLSLFSVGTSAASQAAEPTVPTGEDSGVCFINSIIR